MRTKRYQPTAAQKRFWDELAQGGCVNCGRPAEIHHILGAAAKQNKVHIGQWAVVPVCPDHHRVWEKVGKLTQMEDYIAEVLNPYWRRFGEVPMSKDELLALVTWSKAA